MELDELKAIWQKGHEKNDTLPLKSPKEILEDLEKRTTHTITKLRWSVGFEFWSSVGFFILCSSAFLWLQANVILIGLWLVMGLSMGHYYFKSYLIRTTSTQSSNLKTTLEGLIRLFRYYLRIYDCAVVLLCAFVVGYVAWDYWVFFRRFPHKFIGNRLLFPIGFITIYGVFYYYFYRWYLRLLYGRHLAQLELCLGELSEDES
jgi:hypothetical protein